MAGRQAVFSGSAGRDGRGNLSELARFLRSLIDPYRPELHYMRGPGPRWHAKHRAAPASPPVMPNLARIKS